MSKGINETSVTISGTTTDSAGNDLHVQLTIGASVEARVMDIILSDAEKEIDLTKPSEIMSYSIPGLDGQLLNYTIKKEPATIKNTGNVDITVTISKVVHVGQESDGKSMSMVVQPGESETIETDSVIQEKGGFVVLVELDGANTITDNSRIRQAANGKGYFGISVLKECPPGKPVLCGDGTCVADKNMCEGAQQPSCPPEKPFQCPDGSCVESEAQCPQQPNCPPEKPFQCPDGSCVETEAQCPQQQPTCPPEKPFQCPDGSCAENANMCPN
jgi:hypothetical protein